MLPRQRDGSSRPIRDPSPSRPVPSDIRGSDHSLPRWHRLPAKNHLLFQGISPWHLISSTGVITLLVMEGSTLITMKSLVSLQTSSRPPDPTTLRYQVVSPSHHPGIKVGGSHHWLPRLLPGPSCSGRYWRSRYNCTGPGTPPLERCRKADLPDPPGKGSGMHLYYWW